MNSNPVIPILVAHRGYPACYPENTLVGYEVALQAGACYVELDIQLSAHHTPFLCHDDNLKRLTGIDQNITELDDGIIKTLSIAYPPSTIVADATASPTRTAPFADLLSFCQLLEKWPKAKAFVEIKSESIVKFGLALTVETILQVLQPYHEQCIIISFDWQAVSLARKKGMERIGWVIPRWDQEHEKIADALAPDYLFCSIWRMPPSIEQRWNGPWQWVVYTINDSQTALQYAQQNIGMIETDTIGVMLSDPTLKQHAC
ncbi:MAG: glycerophosphodiester phosphodiesterase [Nitrosomonas sp.]|nr:glycerophosphodiester phosphodiesterase [Nitrosomonas sp.]